MKRHKLLIIFIGVLVVAGVSIVFAGSSNLQGLIFKNFSKIGQNLTRYKPDYSKVLSGICNQSQFKAATILLVQDTNNVQQSVIDKANYYREQTSKDFLTATNNLASMDTTYPLFVMGKENSMFDDFDQLVYPEIISKNFYKSNPDNFDFLLIFVAFNHPGAITHYSVVTRQIEGIGANSADLAALFGSKGKLKGMPFIYSDWWKESQLPVSIRNEFLHEIAHHWAVYAGTVYTPDHSGKLELQAYSGHYYGGIDSPNESGDPLGGSKFIPNKDGTYKQEDYFGFKKYHPFTLYFMGVLPKSEYATQYQVYDIGPGGTNWDKAVPYKKISVNDIIAVEGDRKCK